tara:strand:+ start:9598 stop:9864 length:267 start_codon:yes stop_codon:yes gene_type:complete
MGTAARVAGRRSIRDRLSWMRFLGFSLGDRTPDENTIRHFRNRMTETGTLKRVMKAFDWQLHKKGYIPMSSQMDTRKNPRAFGAVVIH